MNSKMWATIKPDYPKTFFSPRILFLMFITVAIQMECMAAVKLSACNLQSTGNDKSDKCKCIADAGMVVCDGVPGMDEVPTNILPGVETMIIRNASIETLRADDFAGYDDLIGLNLDNLPKLYTINQRPFRNLYKLKYVSLQNNVLTRFDLQGTTFRFLTSLVSIDASGNQITTINRKSFLTILPVEPGASLTVNLRGNKISCGCDVYSLRQWIDQKGKGIFEIDDLLCVNKDNRNFIDVPYSEYPECRAVTVKDTASCQTCTSLSTNYECNLSALTQCSEGQRCQRTVTYTSSTGIRISSKCVAENTCAVRAYKNKETCLPAVVDQNIFNCNYCCTNDICGTESETDRTNDFEFKFNFKMDMASVSPSMFISTSTDYQNRALIAKKQLETALKGFEGGWHIIVNRFEPNTRTSVKVVVTMHFTVFNWLKAVDVRKRMKTHLETFYTTSGNLAMPNGFFRTTKAKCPIENFEFNGVIYAWPETDMGDTVRLLCTNPSNFNASQYAYRQCVDVGLGKAQWGTVFRLYCYDPDRTQKPPSTTTTTSSTTTTTTTTAPATTSSKPPSTLPTVTTSYTPQEAQKTTSQILSYIEDTDSLTSQDVRQVVAMLENMSNKPNLIFQNVSESVLMCVDGVVGASSETLRKSEMSTKLLDLIDTVGVDAPLTRGKFEFSSANFAVAARGLSPTETRDIVFSEAESSNNKMETNVGFNRVPKPGVSNIQIPTKAVLQSLTSRQRQSLNRVTFSLHNDSKLFDTAKVPKSRDYVKISDDNDQTGRDKFYLKDQVNGRVISASVPGVKIDDLSDNITMTFEHKEKNSTNPECVYWDPSLQGGSGDWSSRGCGVISSDNTATTCGCNHLTNFALLMDVYQEGGGLSESDSRALSIISFIGCSISLLALILTLITYSLFRKLRRDTPSKILINLCVALLMTNLIFLAGMQQYTFDSTIACKIVGVLLHYFLLASLTWMAVEAFYMYLALVLVFKTYFSNFLLKISLFGWGVPLVAIAVTLGINSTDNYGLLGAGLCWIKTPAFYFAFVIPVGVILLINFIAFGLVIRQLMQMSSAKLNTSDRYGTMQRLRGAIGVIILLGLTWVFAVFAIDSASVVFYYLFAVFNSLQGLFIFIFYCVFKADAAASWRRFLTCCFDQTDLASTSASRDKPKQNGQGPNRHRNTSLMKMKHTPLATSSTHNAARRKSSNSSGNHTQSTASTVARGSNGNSSHLYDSIDSSYSGNDYNFMNMSHSSQYTATTSPAGQGSMITKFTSDVEAKRVDHGLNHVYSNQPSKYQFDKDNGSPVGQSPPSEDPPYVPHPPDNYGREIPPYAFVNPTTVHVTRQPSQESQPSSPIRLSPGSPGSNGYVSNVSMANGFDGSSDTPASVRDIVGQFERSTSSVANTSI